MGNPNPNEIATGILQRGDYITFKDNKDIYSYEEETGIYKPAETNLETLVQKELGDDAKTFYINETMNSIRRQTYIGREEIGQDPDLIPLENGIFNFKTEQITPYSSEIIFLNKHPIVWTNNPIENNPIDSFLEQVTSNQEDHLLLKELVGYCFYRAMPFQNIFLLYGSGGNGKSVFLDILRNILGDESYSSQSLQNLTRNRFAKASLYNKNANIFGDLPRTALMESGILKELSGGDMVEAEQKFKSGFLFKNHAKIIASCNEVPESPDQTDSWYRRIIIVNFPYTFNKNPNRKLSEELCTEENLSAFFLSCISAFKQALEDNKLIRKETIEEQRKKYLHFSNSAMAFITDKLELDPEMRIECSILFEKYQEYCKERKIVGYPEEHFFRKLYKLYPNSVWKKREMESNVRQYFIHGLDFKD